MMGDAPHWPIAAALVVLATIGLAWLLFAANRNAFAWSPPPPSPDEARSGAVRTTLLIPTPAGEQIEAWLYLPIARSQTIILMAPGLGATKEGPLERFAWGFAQAGYAVIAFDFRSFGGSEGLPRHNVDPRAAVADFEAILAHVHAGKIAGAACDRIVLWGTSFSSAAAICVAAVRPVSGVILHVPYLGVAGRGPGAVQMAGYVVLLLAEMLGDALARRLGVKLNPVYITAYGKPGEATFALSSDCPSRRGAPSAHPFWKGLPRIYRGDWRNVILVRALQHLDAIDPPKALRAATCPVMVIAATRDDMIRIEDTRRICKEAGRDRPVEIDAGHFDPYVEPHFSPNLARQIAFLRARL
jgi:pimeloyl-ACP methyl ester carboxylesterase